MLWQDGKGGARTALWMIDLVSDREKITIWTWQKNRKRVLL